MDAHAGQQLAHISGATGPDRPLVNDLHLAGAIGDHSVALKLARDVGTGQCLFFLVQALWRGGFFFLGRFSFCFGISFGLCFSLSMKGLWKGVSRGPWAFDDFAAFNEGAAGLRHWLSGHAMSSLRRSIRWQRVPGAWGTGLF